MITVIRHSQAVKLKIRDGETGSIVDRIVNVWLDRTGRVAYLALTKGYIRLQQITSIDANIAVCDRWLVNAPVNLIDLHCLAIRSLSGDYLGWIEDFLFDWQTGEISAYIIAGELAADFGGRAVLFPQHIAAFNADSITLKTGANERLESESIGMQGFLCEKSQLVRNLVKSLSDRACNMIFSNDPPELVRLKIEIVSNTIAIDDRIDRLALIEATQFVQQHWKILQESLNRSRNWATAALESAWKDIISKQ
jgi:uncharacterized protein YrrD